VPEWFEGLDAMDLEAREKADPQTKVDDRVGPGGPGQPAGSEAPPTIPRWRRSSGGLIALHLLIGMVAIGFLLGIAVGTVLFAMGRDPDAAVRAASGGKTLAATLIGAMGWMLFVYLRRSGIDTWNGPGSVVYASEDGTEVRFDDFSARADPGQHTALEPPVDLSQFEAE
jgi:hypothetical protein